MFGSSPLISAVLKVSVWSCGRIEEITELRWEWISDDGIISVPDDMAKWGKGRQFRIPMPLLHAIKSYEIKSPFVGDSTVSELRGYHIQRGGKGSANQLAEFTPTRLRGRLQKWIQAWAEESNLTNVSHPEKDGVAVVSRGAASQSRECLRRTFKRRDRRCQKALHE